MARRPVLAPRIHPNLNLVVADLRIRGGCLLQDDNWYYHTKNQFVLHEWGKTEWDWGRALSHASHTEATKRPTVFIYTRPFSSYYAQHKACREWEPSFPSAVRTSMYALKPAMVIFANWDMAYSELCKAHNREKFTFPEVTNLISQMYKGRISKRRTIPKRAIRPLAMMYQAECSDDLQSLMEDTLNHGQRTTPAVFRYTTEGISRIG